MNRKIAAALLALLLLAPAGASATGIPVVDIVAFIQRIYAAYLQYQQVEHAYNQVRSEAKMLESYVNGGHWSDLNGLLGSIDQIFNTYSDVSGNLGYIKVNVDQDFRNTFPGYQPPTVSGMGDYQVRTQRTQETLSLIMKSLNRLTWNNTASQARLAEMTADARAADSPVKAAQAGAMLQTLAVTELQKSLQSSLLTANAVTVGVALQLQADASANRSRNDWISSSQDSNIPPPEATAGATGIPSSASTSLF